MNRDDDGVTISFLNKGGAVVNATTYDEARTKFITAMELYEIVMKIRRHSSAGRAHLS